MTLKVEFDMRGIDAHLAKLTKTVGDAIRPAAQAGAQVFYNEVRARAPRSEKAHSTKGKKHTFQPGNLQRAIYQAFSPEDSADGKRASYNVSWNKKKAFYGHMVEFGTSRQAPASFLRSSYEAKKGAAAQAAQAELLKRLQGAL